MTNIQTGWCQLQYIMVLMLQTIKALVMFLHADSKIIIQTAKSSLITLAAGLKVYASDKNQSGRNPAPEAEVWRGFTGTSVEKQ